MDLQLNRYIDHTLLNPNVMDAAFEDLLATAVKYNFRAVCVSPHIAQYAVQGLLDYPEIDVCTVVSFPHGNLPSELKYDQVRYHIDHGVNEIDWVLNVGEVFNENWDLIYKEMDTIARIADSNSVLSKCIVETGAVISERLLRKLFELVDEVGVDFIKTSSGFNGPGAQIRHVEMWNEMRGNNPFPKIKASGGIKTAEQALALINAGADRLGMSASVEVMNQFQQGMVLGSKNNE